MDQLPSLSLIAVPDQPSKAPAMCVPSTATVMLSVRTVKVAAYVAAPQGLQLPKQCTEVAVVLTGHVKSTVGITGVLAVGQDGLLEARRAVQPLVLNIAAGSSLGPGCATVCRHRCRWRAWRPRSAWKFPATKTPIGLTVSSLMSTVMVTIALSSKHSTPPNHTRHSCCRPPAKWRRLDRVGAVRETVDRAGAGLAAGELLLGRPTVERETWPQWYPGQCPRSPSRPYLHQNRPSGCSHRTTRQSCR